MNQTIIKITAKRFLKGFLAAFLPSIITLLQNEDLSSAAWKSAVLAAVTGGLMAIQKFLKENSKLDENA